MTREYSDHTRPDKISLNARKILNPQKSIESFDEIPLDNWLQDPEGIIDVGCLELPAKQYRSINETPFAELTLMPGEELYTLGYPGGWNATLASTPFWRRGSCASDAGVGIRLSSELTSNEAFFIDAACDEGMSGSPVIQMAYTIKSNSNGTFKFSRQRSFVGVYSHKLDPNDVRDMGIVWKSRVIDHIIDNGVPFKHS